MSKIDRKTVRGERRVGETIMIEGKPVRITRVHDREGPTSCVSGFIIPSVGDHIHIHRFEKWG